MNCSFWLTEHLLWWKPVTIRHSSTLNTRLIHHFHNLKDEIEAGSNNLAKPKKRDVIDIVGNVANSLIGVLDSKYAEQNIISRLQFHASK